MNFLSSIFKWMKPMLNAASVDELSSMSQVSTDRRCDKCHTGISSMSWNRCPECRVYDVCLECDPTDNPTHAVSGCSNASGPLSIVYYSDLTQQDQDLIERKRNERFLELRNKPTAKIEDDRDMWLVYHKKSDNSLTDKNKAELGEKIYQYITEAEVVKILSLDGGGVRGILPLRILKAILPTSQSQAQFINSFDYVAGTSTGGLIAFALIMGEPLDDIVKLYSDSDYFEKTGSWWYPWTKLTSKPLVQSKYDPKRIHKEIDRIVEGSGVSTLGELDRYLHSRYIQNMAADPGVSSSSSKSSSSSPPPSPKTKDRRHQRLIITSFNATTNKVQIFNSGYERHAHFKVADILKATMAAPTYFPPYKIGDHLYLDGGVFANDPELCALWAARMDKRKSCAYRLLSLGTGNYPFALKEDTMGYYAWLIRKPQGLLINKMLEANQSFTETISRELARFSNIKRFKLNYRLPENMDLDDGQIVDYVDKLVPTIPGNRDVAALNTFYTTYISPSSPFSLAANRLRQSSG